MIGVEGAFIFTIFVDQTLKAFFYVFLFPKIVSSFKGTVGPHLSGHCMLYEVVSITGYLAKQGFST